MSTTRPLKGQHRRPVGRPPTFTKEQLAEALAKSGGMYGPAAKLLGVCGSSVRRAVMKNPDMMEGASKMRAADGYTFGRPVQIQPTREWFLDVWERNGRVMRAVARAMNCNQFVVRRLAFDYKVPGAPEKRRPGNR